VDGGKARVIFPTLAKDFPQHRVVNRGFGGSYIADSTYFADRILPPHKPALIVMYAGANDIDHGNTPQVVAADFKAFAAKVWSSSPSTVIAFIAIAPNPARWHQVDGVRKSNKLIAAYCETDPRLKFIDIFPLMLGADGKPEHLPIPDGYPRAGSDWQTITPASLYWGPRFFYDRYKLPLSITENGLAVRDQVFLDGKVHDPQRIDFMHRYLSELSRAIKEGVPVSSYYAWSLLDNFEWADGYKQRFGLVYVDYQNQKRVPKDSFDWYKKLIASNGKILAEKTAMPAAKVTP